MSELKPCPFCGNEVEVEKIHLWYGNGHGYSGCYEFKIKCENCGCTVDQPKNDSIHRSEEEARENAIKAWNRRANDDDTDRTTDDQCGDGARMIDLKKRTITERLIIANSLIASAIADLDNNQQVKG